MSQSDDAGSSATAADSAAAREAFGVKGPGFPEQDDEVTCPSCGRFAGTYERCPYCGAGMRIRLSVRILRRLSVAVGILGVLLVWWSARNMEVPLRQIGDFGPTENFAIVRLKGEIVSGPYYGDRGDSFYIGLDDGTGRVNVKAYGGTATALRKRYEAKPLHQKDKVEVRGSIRIQAGKNSSLSLRVPADFARLSKAAQRVQAKAIPVGSITREMAKQGLKVRVEAKVVKAWKTGSGVGATLDDGTGRLMAWMFSKDLSRAPHAADVLSPGNTVRVTGRLDLYVKRRSNKETIQIRPFANASGIELIQMGNPPPRREAPPKLAPARVPPAPVAVTPVPSTPVSLPYLAPSLDEVGQPAPGSVVSPAPPATPKVTVVPPAPPVTLLAPRPPAPPAQPPAPSLAPAPETGTPKPPSTTGS